MLSDVPIMNRYNLIRLDAALESTAHTFKHFTTEIRVKHAIRVRIRIIVLWT